jgi:hypothetical protein
MTLQFCRFDFVHSCIFILYIVYFEFTYNSYFVEHCVTNPDPRLDPLHCMDIMVHLMGQEVLH